MPRTPLDVCRRHLDLGRKHIDARWFDLDGRGLDLDAPGLHLAAPAFALHAPQFHLDAAESRVHARRFLARSREFVADLYQSPSAGRELRSVLAATVAIHASFSIAARAFGLDVAELRGHAAECRDERCWFVADEKTLRIARLEFGAAGRWFRLGARAFRPLLIQPTEGGAPGSALARARNMQTYVPYGFLVP